MGYLLLAAAIVSEVVATSFLRLTSSPAADGKAPIWPYAIVAVGYIASFVLLQRALSAGMPLGISYAIWAGVGVVLVAVISWVVFHESLTLVQLGGMALVIAGVALLELGGAHHAAS